MQTQIDIPKDLNKKLKIYRVENDFPNKETAIIKILEEKLAEK